jgi:hypothetical protein
MISHLLSAVPWQVVDREEVEIPPRPAPGGYERPPRNVENYVPDVASEIAHHGAGPIDET